jgi:hypothetical protein
MPSNRTATKARAISRNRSIIGCPLTGNSLGRRLTVDGVDNKANGRFCRAGRYGDGSALVVFLNPVFRLGAIRVRTRVVSMFNRAGCRRDLVPRAPWQIGHTAGAISALRKRSQSRRNYKVGCWHGVFGEHVRSFPNISELTGGDCGEGRATVSLSRAPTAPRLAALVHQRKPRRPRASAGDPRPFSRRKESNEVGHE